jgi:putative Ca2+/H+ antiporter (TMEM165/GDT1 family)
VVASPAPPLVKATPRPLGLEFISTRSIVMAAIAAAPALLASRARVSSRRCVERRRPAARVPVARGPAATLATRGALTLPPRFAASSSARIVESAPASAPALAPLVEAAFAPAPPAPRASASRSLAAIAAVAATGSLLALAPESRAAVDAAADLAAAAEPGSLSDGFLSAFLLIFFSEIGDKTFFIAVLLATQQPKSSVFAGTFGALAVMTVISVAIGQVFHVAEESLAVFTSDVPWDDYLAVALLLVFGVQTLLSAEEETAEEEEEDAKIAVAGMQFDGAAALVLSTFALVFAAEWGDKSFIATIALSAAASPAGVVLGATAGHGVATGIAVLVGDVLGDVISERVVKYTGGALFILFAIATALDIQ